MSGQNFSPQLRAIEQKLKIANSQVNTLRKEKKKLMTKLYQYMCDYNLEELDGYLKSKLEVRVMRRPKPPQKTDAQKRKDAINLFRQIGIQDPKQFWQEFEQTQRSVS